jgi:hypothetical protein
VEPHNERRSEDGTQCRLRARSSQPKARLTNARNAKQRHAALEVLLDEFGNCDLHLRLKYFFEDDAQT